MDEHLFAIESQIHLKVREKQLCLETLMGDKDELVVRESQGVFMMGESCPNTTMRGTFADTYDNKCSEYVQH